MRILIAPNAFKNSLSADRAADAIEAGIIKSGLNCLCEKFPVADGGDGTASLLIEHFKGERIWREVQDPLGRPVRASIGLIDDGKTAVIEMADASGLRLLKSAEYDPLHSSSYGTGQLILHAMDLGASKIILGVGGTATVDGGLGALAAMGLKIVDANHRSTSFLPADADGWHAIQVQQLRRPAHLIILCDVKNPLLGEHGAASVFGPQKGADAADIEKLESALTRIRDLVLQVNGKDIGEIESGGAAGGITATMHALLDAKIVNGIEYFLDETEFDAALQKADLVITGEGRIDEQTLRGKAPFGVATRARQKHIPVIAMAGEVGGQEKLSDYFAKLVAINKKDESLAASMLNTDENLRLAAMYVGEWLKENSL